MKIFLKTVTQLFLSLIFVVVPYTQAMQIAQTQMARNPVKQRISLQQEYNKLMNIKIRTPEQEARIEELRTELKNASNAIRFRSRGL